MGKNLVIMLMFTGLARISYCENVRVDSFNENLEAFHTPADLNSEKISNGEEKNVTKRGTFFSKIDKNLLNDYPSYFGKEGYFIKKKSNVSENENDKEKYYGDLEEQDWQDYEDEVGSPLLRSENIYNEQQKPTAKFNFEKKQNVFQEKVIQSDENMNSNFYSFNSEDQQKNDQSKGNLVINNMGGDQRYMKNQKLFNDEMETFDDTRFRYPSRPNMGYRSSHNPEFYCKGKGLVINFNTECSPSPITPITKPIRKFTFPPQAQICYPIGFPSYQIPDSNLISSRHINSRAYHYQ